MAAVETGKMSHTLPTNELVYIFCAAAWVGAVLEQNAHDLTIPYVALLLASFCLIPVEYHTSILWRKVASAFDTTDSDIKKSAKHESQLSMLDILRIFFLTIMFIYIGTPLSGAERGSNLNSRTCIDYILMISAFLILSGWWNNITFFGKIFVIPTIDNDYNRLFQKYFSETKRTTNDDDFRYMFFRLSVLYFQWVNFALFVYVLPFIGWILLIIGVLAKIGIGLEVSLFSEYIWMIALIFFLGQASLKIVHVILVSAMLVDAGIAKSKSVISA